MPQHDDLASLSTIEEAANWLTCKLGGNWTLTRMLEAGITPWFWLDYSTDAPAEIFGDKTEGYLARMAFAGDINRLAACKTDALITMTETHDEKLIRLTPGIPVSLSELRFKREDLHELAQTVEECHMVDACSETLANGTSINWRYWMSMKTLTAEQSSRLMVGLDPDIFSNLSNNGPTRNDTSSLRDRAKKIERLALNLGMAEANASEWLLWAKNHALNIHPTFALEIADRQIDEALPLLTDSLLEEDDSSEQLSTVTEVGSRIPLEQRFEPLQRQAFQEQEIIKTLKRLGYNPKSIPKWKAGKPGVKKEVLESLDRDNYWSKKVFDKAWQRLRDAGEIAEKD